MQLSPSQQFGLFTVRENSFTIDSTATVEVAKQDGTRIGIIFSASDNATGYRISPKSDATKDDGLWVPNGSRPIEFSHTSFGALVGQSWHAHTPAGLCILTVVEVLLPQVPNP